MKSAPSMTKGPWPTARGALGCSLLLSLILTGGMGSAQAQWAWRDANGEITYSDTPPPADVSRSNILRQPTGVSPSNTDTTSAAPSAPAINNGGPVPATPRTSAPASAPPSPAPQASKPNPAPKSLAEQDADFRKRLTERQKAEEKEEQDEAQASQRAEACNQAKTYMDMLQGGTRLLRPDANGERNFLDDDQRAAEVQKTQDAINKNCS